MVGRKHFLESTQFTGSAAKMRNVKHQNCEAIKKQPPPD
jgi:hypothetical protein